MICSFLLTYLGQNDLWFPTDLSGAEWSVVPYRAIWGRLIWGSLLISLGQNDLWFLLTYQRQNDLWIPTDLCGQKDLWFRADLSGKEWSVVPYWPSWDRMICDFLPTYLGKNDLWFSNDLCRAGWSVVPCWPIVDRMVYGSLLTFVGRMICGSLLTYLGNNYWPIWLIERYDICSIMKKILTYDEEWCGSFDTFSFLFSFSIYFISNSCCLKVNFLGPENLLWDSSSLNELRLWDIESWL